MCLKIQSNGSLQKVKDYVVQKQWVAVALLITSVVVFGLLASMGGVGLFAKTSALPHWLAQAVGTIGHTGAYAALGSGGVATVLGTAIAIALLINKGRSSLHRAIESKKPIPQQLSAKEVNAKDYDGQTPLHYAAAHNHALEELLAVPGVNLETKDQNDNTPLDIAIKSKQIKAIETLLSISTPKTSTITWAIQHAPQEIVDLLLQQDRVVGSWREPLFAALEAGNIDYFRGVLIKYNDPAHQDLKNALIATASLYRRSNEYKKIFQMLLDHGVSVNSHNGRRTALHQAALNGNIELVMKLLNTEGINVNLLDNFRETPLETAVQWGRVTIAIEIIRSEKVHRNNLIKVKQLEERWQSHGSRKSEPVLLEICKLGI